MGETRIMEDEMASPAARRTVEVLVYVRESGEAACTEPVGYEATITVDGEGLAGCVMRPLTAPHHEWAVHPGSALWSVVRSFLMVLPALRGRAAMRPVREVA